MANWGCAGSLVVTHLLVGRARCDGLSVDVRAVGAGQDIEPVADRIVEVEASPAVVGVDLLWARRVRVSRVRDPQPLHPTQNLIEAIVINQKHVVLHLDLLDRQLGELDEHDAVKFELV